MSFSSISPSNSWRRRGTTTTTTHDHQMEYSRTNTGSFDDNFDDEYARRDDHDNTTHPIIRIIRQPLEFNTADRPQLMHSSRHQSFLRKIISSVCKPFLSSILWSSPKQVVVLAGLLSGFLFCFSIITLKADNPQINQTLGVAIWMATLWLTEVIPVVVTSFLPLVLFPMFGVLTGEQIATQYMNDTIWLLIAGFLVALTLQRWGIHKRFAYKILTWCGSQPARLLLGIMTTTFVLSMFVSNTATTLMMVPNATSICSALQQQQQQNDDNDDGEVESGAHPTESAATRPTTRRSQEQQQDQNSTNNYDPFTQAILLGIAYSASVGGMASLIGTGPNLVFHQQLHVLFPKAPEITFAEWLAFGLPIGLVLFILIWLYLCIKYKLYGGNQQQEQQHRPDREDDDDGDDNQQTESLTLLLAQERSQDNHDNDNDDDNNNHVHNESSQQLQVFEQSYKDLGEWTREQIIVCTLFFILCLMWIFRSDIDLGKGLFKIPGWSNLFPQPTYIKDGTTGMIVVILLFVCPARSCNLDCDNDDNDNETTKEERSSADNNNSNNNDEVGEDEDVEEMVVTLATSSEVVSDNDHHDTSSSYHNKNDTTLLDWETANRMPYSVVFLMGGGFALAKAFVSSGLSQYLGEQLASLSINGKSLVFLMITMIVWLTELTANTSTANIMVPIAASMATATKISPYTYMIPATMACSCAFALPIATPPNMVVYGTGQLQSWEMNQAGIFLNLVSPFLLFGVAYTIIPRVLGVGAEEYPSWGDSGAVAVLTSP